MIRKNTLSNGSVTYTAQVRFKKDGRTIYQETQTFEREKTAKTWHDSRRAELEKPGALEKKLAPAGTLSEVIDSYINDKGDNIGRTKSQVLRSLKEYDISKKPIADIIPRDVVDLAKQLGRGGREPQTVGNYISHLGAVFRVARTTYGYAVDTHVMSDAHEALKEFDLVSKSEKRQRRPTVDEMDRLMQHFDDIKTRRPSSNPMVAICIFAMFSTRRQEEITRICWSDLDEKHSRILVRNMKHPGQKRGNHVLVDLPPEALAVMKKMPRIHDEIFPYSTDAISAAFTRACQFLEIEDLHFHDLRHEGISRLFELGWTIPQVAMVSGHRSWQSLQRYSHLRQAGDKWAGWSWLKEVAPDFGKKEEGEG